jgi:uncharacterized protein YutE (UPF0331/DUF86 family)
MGCAGQGLTANGGGLARIPETIFVNFNSELLRHRASEIRTNIALLRQVAALPVEEFLVDKDKQDASMFRLLVAIEAAQAICTHLAARIPTKSPDSMGECFEGLRDHGLFEDSLCQNLCQMARFRNLLVHRYWQIDLSLVYNFLNDHLEDLEQYIESVARYIGDDL